MENLFIVAIGIAFLGFIVGLAGKAISVKKKLPDKNEFFNRFTGLFLILLFVLVIFYQFII
ncbi:MAG: hypothetical protein K8S16_20855 [Bacteroidales bacterium]|nr:hypothetical protein [Bacteroidales bacterium]